jgi:hypothetical protein
MKKKYKFPTSLSGWRERWFYIGNHEPSLPERTVGALKICYRHNLIGPRDGPRATWAEGDHRDGLRIGSCASVLRAGMAVCLVRIV